LGAFCFGVAGCVLGVWQEWWTGPLAELSGGDLGIPLALASPQFPMSYFGSLREVVSRP